MRGQILEAVKFHYEAKKLKAKTNIEIYLINPAGIGEHSDIMEEVIKLMEEYDKNKSILETIESDFSEK